MQICVIDCKLCRVCLYRWWLILMLQTQATQPWGSTCTGERASRALALYIAASYVHSISTVIGLLPTYIQRCAGTIDATVPPIHAALRGACSTRVNASGTTHKTSWVDRRTYACFVIILFICASCAYIIRRYPFDPFMSMHAGWWLTFQRQLMTPTVSIYTMLFCASYACLCSIDG